MRPTPPAVQAAPNVTPMIDVMLVLLIIFMVVAPTLLDGVPLEPPRGANLRARPPESGDVTLVIDPSGRYYLNKRPIAAADLAPRLRALYAGGRTDYVLYLKADRRLDYARVLAAIDVARESGVRVVGMVTEQARPVTRRE